MKIYRIDGCRCFGDPVIGISHHATKELAEQCLISEGFHIDTQDLQFVLRPTNEYTMWYNNNKIFDDNTSYRFIVEIGVNEG